MSDDLRLNLSGEAAGRDQQTSPEPVEEVDFEGDGMSGSGNAPSAGRRPDELGNSRGKRMAMKFVNKIASKEKYTQVNAGMEYAGHFA